MIVRTVRGKTPRWGKECFIAENAVLTGDVVLGDGCSVWYGAVLRGDVHYIHIGDRVNIQDGVVIHATYRKFPTRIGNDVSIAHNATVHGCTIHDKVLIGMNAVILDGAVIETGSIIAAGSVVTKGTRVESGSVYAGIPAKKIKDLPTELLEGEIIRIAGSYKMYASWYQQGEPG